MEISFQARLPVSFEKTKGYATQHSAFKSIYRE